MTDNLLVHWNGPNTIKGIIAVRMVFGLGLKQAINLLKDTEGFVITPLQWVALRGEYMLKRRDGPSDNREVNDWLVKPYKPISPVWLVDHICYNEYAPTE